MSGLVPPANNNQPPMSLTKALIIIAAFAIGIFLLFNSCANAGSEARDSGTHQRANAQVACERIISDQLRSPSTADFSSRPEARGGNQYTVTGTVDAQNGFGAMVRATYECDVRMTGERADVTIVDFSG